MDIHGFVRRAGLVVAVLAASFSIVPSAFARVHVGVGISVPGVVVGVGNCWNCGYYPPPPPVYYQPAYAGPAYYPAPVYYTPRPVYYGYGYAPYYPRHYYYRGYHRGYPSHYRRGYHHHGHR
jgi:hypothetical protein